MNIKCIGLKPIRFFNYHHDLKVVATWIAALKPSEIPMVQKLRFISFSNRYFSFEFFSYLSTSAGWYQVRRGAVKGWATLLLLFTASTLTAGDAQVSAFREAGKFYSSGKYEDAIKLYKQVLEDGYESPELYYNLGNAYYKNGKMALAILNYERAKKLSPMDEDILFNLQLANQRIKDRIEAVPQLFIKELKNDFFNSYSEKTWSYLCILFITLGFASLVFYVLAKKTGWKQLCFGTGVLFFAAATITFFIAESRYSKTSRKTEGIIMSPAVEVAGSPTENGTRLFELHEGTKVSIQKTDGDWSEIKIANGNVGWVKSEVFEAF